MISLPNTGNTCGPRTRSRAPLPPCGTARSARRAASRIRRRSPWCSSWSMRRRKAGAGSMATTSCPSSFKVSGSPTGSKSPPTPRPRNPKPPPPDPSGHHQDSAIAQLSGTVRQDGLATQNRFSFPGNEDNRVRYLLTLFDDYLARREGDPAGKARHFQKISLVNRAKCHAVQFLFLVAKDYRAPIQGQGHDPNPVDDDECRSPEDRRPERFVLKIVVRQYHDIGRERQNAQLEDISHRKGQ